MALVDYKKYQVSIKPDSKKVQGLQTGDIIRRQYFDGTNIIYSLMCVLSYGTEQTMSRSGDKESRAYFIGALLEGDKLDGSNKNEIFDFARITNLFNTDRSGALYLTASDDQAPYMDVIDGVGRNESLSWPEALASEGFEDASTQYIVKGGDVLQQQYTKSEADNSRILTVTRLSAAGNNFEGLKQDFYEFVRNNNQVLISYKVRGSKAITGVKASLGYSDDLHKDAEWIEDILTSWEYKFRMVTVEYSGRHLRSFKLDMSALEVGQQIQIADFNIILLSSVANFADASATRVGKLDGVVDKVFGQITGYGAYLQKLYASRSAHISGTLTAGDENGFGATFYAGKIHRNCFVNSLSPDFVQSVHVEKEESSDVVNPTGIGSVYSFSTTTEIVAQTNSWMLENEGARHCFSFWIYMKQPGNITVSQNGKQIGNIEVASDQTYEWRRVHVCFDILKSEVKSESLIFKLAPAFVESEYERISADESNSDEAVLYFTAPQLESGDAVTQYQATDETLNPTTDYGAWFSRGGIGGTMQNPLLQLNFKDDEGNEGGIGTRSKSFLLRQDGSGYLAKKNIVWDENGKVTFGDKVTLNWGNLDDEVQDEIKKRSCVISGDDLFKIIKDEKFPTLTIPETIVLSVEETGFTSTSEQRQWFCKKEGEWIAIEDANSKTLTVTANSNMWDDAKLANGETVDSNTTLTVKYVVVLDELHVYSDTKTLRKEYYEGYTIKITSSQGTMFKNGTCDTVLTANVYYQGNLVELDVLKKGYFFKWHRYRASDMTELELNFTQIDINAIKLDYNFNEEEVYECELITLYAFEYLFPIIF